MDKKFWATAFTLTGTVIGAGILGLPYVFAQSGFLIGVMWLLILGAVMITVNLIIGEVALRTKGIHHLPGYAKIYLGNWGKGLMFFAVVFGIYSALIAYIIGEGESLSKLFTGGVEYALYFGIGFWLLMTLLLREGLKGLKKLETWGVISIILIIFGIFIWLFPSVQIGNISYLNFDNFFVPFGVTLFALLGFSSIPELRILIKGNEKKLKKVIFVGMLIPLILYVLFAVSVVGVLGVQVPEVATLAFGGIILILGIFTMLTSYFVLSFALKDIFKYDLHESKLINFIFVSILPLILYLIIVFFEFAGFVKVLGIGGVISGGLTGILILFVHRVAKKKGKRKPEFSVFNNWIIISILSLIFGLGVFVELFF
ncbi:MAG: aromatic amino acid transport family protein [Nanoarchaeota archaeon]|nr:aromatic amino acid transport family protein [Nanoarchaeota archaeon]